jgi:hypothetical protein
MSNLERDVMYKPGAVFFKDGDALMFRFQADSSSVIGPRPATDADKKTHGFEYEQYLAGAFHHAPLEAFDHDGVDGPGGAAPATPPPPKKRGRPPKA